MQPSYSLLGNSELERIGRIQKNETTIAGIVGELSERKFKAPVYDTMPVMLVPIVAMLKRNTKMDTPYRYFLKNDLHVLAYYDFQDGGGVWGT